MNLLCGYVHAKNLCLKNYWIFSEVADKKKISSIYSEFVKHRLFIIFISSFYHFAVDRVILQESNLQYTEFFSYPLLRKKFGNLWRTNFFRVALNRHISYYNRHNIHIDFLEILSDSCSSTRRTAKTEKSQPKGSKRVTNGNGFSDKTEALGKLSKPRWWLVFKINGGKSRKMRILISVV